jgi:hypothetical protein
MRKQRERKGCSRDTEGGAAAEPPLRLGFCREQLAEVFVELTDRIRISTE